MRSCCSLSLAECRVLNAEFDFYCGLEESAGTGVGGGAEAGTGGGSTVGVLCEAVGAEVCDVVGMACARGASGPVVMALSGFSK